MGVEGEGAAGEGEGGGAAAGGKERSGGGGSSEGGAQLDRGPPAETRAAASPLQTQISQRKKSPEEHQEGESLLPPAAPHPGERLLLHALIVKYIFPLRSFLYALILKCIFPLRSYCEIHLSSTLLF